jgi:soluble lytic murein transglycosylase
MKRRKRIFLLISLFAALAAAWCGHAIWRETRFQLQIQTAARRYGVDPLLVRAVIWRESRFRPDKQGRKGEIGLMQIQETAAREWASAERLRAFTHEDCRDAGTNTLAGTYYLGKLIKRYAATDNPIPYALADYNAGRSNVLKWNAGSGNTNSAVFIQQIGFPGTRNYVEAVLRRYSFYQFLSGLGWG